MNMEALLLLANPDTAKYWGGRHVLFVHNWRTAGTSMHSLLSANVTERYLKVGDHLNRFGKVYMPAKPGADNTTLAQIRSRMKPGSVLAGHLALGLDAFIPGSWDYWISAREPIARVRSGLMRFHSPKSRSRRAINDLIQSTASLEDPDSIRKLLDGPMRRESNGMCRRLAAISLCKSLKLSDSDNLESLPVLESDLSDTELLSAARTQLPKVRCLIITEALSASIVSLEKLYHLPPLINPFSALNFNSSHPMQTRSGMHNLDQANNAIVQSQQADIALWPILKQRFQKQVVRLGIRKRDVALKSLIHSQALFEDSWFFPGQDAQTTLKRVANATKTRSTKAPELAEGLINTICNWPGFTSDAQDSLRKLLT